MGAEQSTAGGAETTPVTPSRVTASLPMDMRSPSAAMRADVAETRTALEDFLSTLGEMNDSKRQLEERFDKERRDRERILQEVKDVCDKRIATLEKLCEEYRTQAIDVKEAADNQIQELQDRLQSAQEAHEAELENIQAGLEDRYNSTLASTKRALEEELSIQASRHTAAASASAAKLDSLLSENRDLKEQLQTQSANLTAELAECRQEAVALHEQMGRKEKAYAEEVAALTKSIQEGNAEVSNLRDELSETSARLGDAQDGNHALAAEIKKLKEIFFREKERITPSKKKRKTVDTSQTTDASPDEDTNRVLTRSMITSEATASTEADDQHDTSAGEGDLPWFSSI